MTSPVSVPTAPVVKFGRIPVQSLAPLVDGGQRPAKAVVGEEFVVAAQVFREGHSSVNATAVLVDPQGREHRFPMHRDNEGLSWWSATVAPDSLGWWTYRVEGWSDPVATWSHDAWIKVPVDADTELMLEEGARVLEQALASLPAGVDGSPIASGIAGLRNTSMSPMERLRAGSTDEMWALLGVHPYREFVSPTTAYPLLVERQRALYGAWYEIFPRSEGCTFDAKTGRWTSGNFRTAAKRLPAIADMGFDVVYLTPIHPIGEVNRKGPNNTLVAGPLDPGSPYAIGSAAGGHDAIHPDLGTFEDFDYFVAEAERLGMEVALDIALQCAPDHPWVKEHPEWFTTRADGTIAYAENPPKKYQDIYPLNFDNDPAGAYAEMRRMIQVWIDHGVKIFRVDNPHTKPVEFWQWIIADVAKDHPAVIWLSEAFTKPAMMRALATAGFQQSYTYYAWRNARWELEEYMTELATETAAYMRPNFWPTTHDILTPYMQYGGPVAWQLRAALAAMLSPSYGIYAGYELMENVARPGVEEQIDNEKYQYKDRKWEDYAPGGPKAGRSLAGYLKRINEIRRQHPALHWLRNFELHRADDPNVMVFSKSAWVTDADGHRRRDTILVACNLDPHATRETTIHLNMAALGLDPWSVFGATDLLSGQTWQWGEHNFVRLGPGTQPIHIIEVSA